MCSSAAPRESRASCSCSDGTAASSNRPRGNPGRPTGSTTTGGPCSSMPKVTDVTEEVAPELARPGGGGMITAAVWIDFDGDGRLDLVTAGEWMPLQFFHNEGGKLRNVTASIGLPPMRGWWYSLATGDFNHDGHPDLVAGNAGLNFAYQTSLQSRFGVYAADFTGSLTTDI